MRDISDNARARCIVISSTGKHFSAGMDLAVFGGGGVDKFGRVERPRRGRREPARTTSTMLQDCFSCLDEARMPVIVAIQGGCIGGAVDMTSACDIRYATADAFFVIQEINIGMTADVGTFPAPVQADPRGLGARTGLHRPAHARRRRPGRSAGSTRCSTPRRRCWPTPWRPPREIASKAPLAVAGRR